MAFHDILEKILLEAETQAEALRTKMVLDGESLRQRLLDQGAVAQSDLQDTVQQKLDAAVTKAERLAHHDGRMYLLERKAAFVDLVLASVVDSLASIPAKEYEDLLVALMKKIPESEGELLWAEGKANSTKGAIKIAKKNFTIGESIPAKGGFKLITPTAEYDFTFETLVMTVYKDRLQDTISNTFFQ